MVKRRLRVVVLWLIVLLPSGSTLAGPSCPNSLVDVTLPTGSRWQMCWVWSLAEGFYLREIYFTTPAGLERKVLTRASLAQVWASPDDGSPAKDYIPDFELGKKVRTLPLECAGTLHQNRLCQVVEPRGYAYKHYSSQKQGYALRLYSIYTIGDRNFTSQWRFLDDGTIEPSIGISGVLEEYGTDARYGWPVDSSGTIAISSVYNYFWRLDFDIAGNGANDIVEEVTFPPNGSASRREMSVTALSTEQGLSIDPENFTAWRVRDATVTNGDGHHVSYEIAPLEYTSRHSGSQNWTQSQLYVTADDPCEVLASGNSTEGGCGGDVTAFVDGEDIHTADVVVWYGLTGHLLPRDEDEPYMSLRWDGFQLTTRDWTEESPL